MGDACYPGQIKTLIGAALLHKWSMKADPRFLDALINSLAGSIDEQYQSALQNGLRAAIRVLLAAKLVSNDVITKAIAAAGLPTKAVAGTLKKVLNKSYKAAYAHGKASIMGPHGMKPKFGLIDSAAVNWLEKDTMFWIGEHWNRQLGAEIATIAKEEILQKGYGVKDAARRMEAVFQDKFQKDQNYWKIVANQASVRASSFGAIQGMVDIGATTYEYWNPMDERTTPNCASLNGKQFTVESAVQVRDNLLASGSPEEAKEAHPWPANKEVIGMDRKAIEAAGYAVPPIHAMCRSDIIVTGYDEPTDMSNFTVDEAPKEKPHQALIDAGLFKPDDKVYAKGSQRSVGAGRVASGTKLPKPPKRPKDVQDGMRKYGQGYMAMDDTQRKAYNHVATRHPGKRMDIAKHKTKHGISDVEHKAMHSEIDSANIVMNLPLKPGETGVALQTGKLGGWTKPGTKGMSKWEDKIFGGVYKGSDINQKPSYGLLDISRGKQKLESELGEIRFVLKSQVKNRTTFAPQNTLHKLNEAKDRTVVAKDLDMMPVLLGARNRKDLHEIFSPGSTRMVGAHVHGGVDIGKDVSWVEVPKKVWANEDLDAVRNLRKMQGKYGLQVKLI